MSERIFEDAAVFAHRGIGYKYAEGIESVAGYFQNLTFCVNGMRTIERTAVLVSLLPKADQFSMSFHK